MRKVDYLIVQCSKNVVLTQRNSREIELHVFKKKNRLTLRIGEILMRILEGSIT